MPSKRKRRGDKVIHLRIHPARIFKVTMRLALMIALIVAFIFFVHGVRELTASVVGVKFVEVLTDVLADRIFPNGGL